MARDLVNILSALADRSRLRLLNLMRRREVCVCYFVEILGMAQPKVSRHLAYLRRAGLVNARREGKWIHYTIARPDDPDAASVLDTTLKAIESERQMVRDTLMLERACCAVKLPAALQHAPKPQPAGEQPDA